MQWTSGVFLKPCSSWPGTSKLHTVLNYFILQDREATLQCILCLRAKVELRKSFTCSTDCLRQHWNVHKNLHLNGELI